MKIPGKIVAVITLILGLNAFIPLLAIAQQSQQVTNVGAAITEGTLSIIYTPADLNLEPVNIVSPSDVYYSYYDNLEIVDPDMQSLTRDGTALQVQDSRYNGGFELQGQVDTNFISEGNEIDFTNLGIKTSNSIIIENVIEGTPAAVAPLDTPSDYTTFDSAIVLISASTTECITQGRIGLYTIFPSFRLLVPNSAAAGSYTATLTYTLIESPACGGG